MTKKIKKIIFIDDEENRLRSLEEKCKKMDLTEFTSSFENYFKFDKAGKSLHLTFEKEDLDYLFIHHSFNDPKIPGNRMALIERELGGKRIIRFSGGRENDLSQFIISRECLYQNFERFLSHFNLYNEWFIPSLVHDDYIKRYGKKILEEFKRTINLSNWENSDSHNKLIRLLSIDKNSSKKFETIGVFLSELQTKIEEL